MIYRVIWTEGKIQKHMDFGGLPIALKWSYRHNGKIYKVVKK